MPGRAFSWAAVAVLMSSRFFDAAIFSEMDCVGMDCAGLAAGAGVDWAMLCAAARKRLAVSAAARKLLRRMNMWVS
jgi:hypothetical protein